MVPGVPLARLLEEYGRQCAVSNEIIAAHPLDEPGRHPDFDDAAAGTASGCGVRRALRLRPLRPDDEMAFRAACDAMAADGFTFGLGLEPGMPWSSYLRTWMSSGQASGCPRPRCPRRSWLPISEERSSAARPSVTCSTTFSSERAATSATASSPDTAGARLCHRDPPAEPGHRRANGVGRVLMICDDGNVGSSSAIEACGGRLDCVARLPGHASPIRRYWID